MPQHFRKRLAAIRKQLMAAHDGSAGLSTATIGRERELFINLFLKNVFPPHFRFGSGDLADSRGRRTGQLDIVIELPFFPSLPLVGIPEQRLYFVESVCAVIEVKSDLKRQWNEVKKTASSLGNLTHGGFTGEARDTRFGVECIAFIAVGFRGWARTTHLRTRRQNGVGAILQLDPPIFVAPGRRTSDPDVVVTGDYALGAMVTVLNEHLMGWSLKRTDLLAYFENA